MDRHRRPQRLERIPRNRHPHARRLTSGHNEIRSGRAPTRPDLIWCPQARRRPPLRTANRATGSVRPARSAVAADRPPVGMRVDTTSVRVVECLRMLGKVGAIRRALRRSRDKMHQEANTSARHPDYTTQHRLVPALANLCVATDPSIDRSDDPAASARRRSANRLSPESDGRHQAPRLWSQVAESKVAR
jgi:hypothetical protein